MEKAVQLLRAVGIRSAVFLSLLLVFSNVVSYVEAQREVVKLPPIELSALQDLLGAWNKNTTDINSSLPGWASFDPADTTQDPCYYDSWRGVFCYLTPDFSLSQYNANVVSLTVSDASIVGTLPSSIWNFYSIISVTLSGNPGLSGPIPDLKDDPARSRTLKSLDLHGNAFNGSIPQSLIAHYTFIENLDLSNNRLEGSLPVFPNNTGEQYLRTLRLANNKLTGNISGSFWRKLVVADFSNNSFTGSFPYSDMASASSLHTLNVSHNSLEGNRSNILWPKTLVNLDLSYNKFTGSLPYLGFIGNLRTVDLSHNAFDAYTSLPGVSFLENLQTLDLSNTSMTGTLDPLMFCTYTLTSLRTLGLDNNNINGTLDIDNLLTCNYSSLRTIKLRNNSITNVKFNPASVVNLPISIQLSGNPYCGHGDSDIKRCLCEQQCFNTSADSKNNKILIASAVGGSIGVTMMIISAILLWKNKRDNQYLLLTVHKKFAEYEMKPTLFAYGELEKATRNFHPDMKLGEGAFGAVYKGKLTDGSEVAVKQLLTNAQQNMDDFLNEVVLLTSVKHRNLVKLKGCCLRGNRRLLVYEYLDNYDLGETLFDGKGNQLITWLERFNICLGVAHGLHYLHAGVEPRILHRDIKANNVLLDQNLHPKIADFGLAMLFPNEESHITIIQVAGTKGYLAPEYATRGQLSDKVDVFSYGVLALEVVSGRKNISFDVEPDKTYLIEWASKLNKEGRLMDLVDPILSIPLDEEVVVQRVINVALACTQTSAERRPTMAQVVGMLQGDIEIGETLETDFDENATQTYRTLLGINNRGTTLMTVDEENLSLVPNDEESQVLRLGESSNLGSSSVKPFEVSSMGPR